MSKRAGSSMVVVAKHPRVEPSEGTATSRPTSSTTHAVDGSLQLGAPSSTISSKLRLLQAYTLSYQPRVEVSINLNGVSPEVRFASPESSICLTGDELVDLSNRRDLWPANALFLNETRVEPLPDGGIRLVRYDKDTPNSQTDMFYFVPVELVTLSKTAVDRLKQKLDLMCAHVQRIYASEPTIHHMFASIVNAYECEHKRLFSTLPMSRHFEKLTRLVETHVLPTQIVREFCYHSSGSVFNPYSLLDSALSQKAEILSRLESKD